MYSIVYSHRDRIVLIGIVKEPVKFIEEWSTKRSMVVGIIPGNPYILRFQDHNKGTPDAKISYARLASNVTECNITLEGDNRFVF